MPALIGSAVTATVAMMCGLAFPLVIQWVIDGPIAQQDLSALWPLAGLLLALGVVEAGLFWVREAEALPGGVVRPITTQCMFDDCGIAGTTFGQPVREN